MMRECSGHDAKDGAYKLFFTLFFLFVCVAPLAS